MEVGIAVVGRIISKGIKTGKIQAVSALLSRRHRKRRIFNKHAERWQYGMKGNYPGELVQIDHMTIYYNSKSVKHFKAVCPVTRIMVAQVYGCATSSAAARFLDYLIQEMPFKIWF